MRHKISEKTRIDFRPIIRFNEDISNYQNFSIDLAFQHKLLKGWYIQFLSRTWFLPEAPEGQFLWGDLGHQLRIEGISVTNRVRLHYAFNTNKVNPDDFIRYQLNLNPDLGWKIKPFFSIEPWFMLSGVHAFKRIRYEPGINYLISNSLNLTVMYRRQDSLRVNPPKDQNHYVITLTYHI